MSDQTHEAIGDAIRQHLAERGGNPVITKWIIVAEAIRPDTNEFQHLATIASDGLSTWDAAGMAGFAEAAAKHNYSVARDGSDD